jgi:hypothetical protein
LAIGWQRGKHPRPTTKALDDHRLSTDTLPWRVCKPESIDAFASDNSSDVASLLLDMILTSSGSQDSNGKDTQYSDSWELRILWRISKVQQRSAMMLWKFPGFKARRSAVIPWVCVYQHLLMISGMQYRCNTATHYENPITWWGPGPNSN